MDAQRPGSSQTQDGSPAESPPYRPLERWVYLLALGVIVATAIVYIPSYRAEFIWDDDDYILLNPLVTEPGGLSEIWNPGSPLNPQYYPLVFTMFRLEYMLWGLNPLGYHVVNVLLHALAATLLLFLLFRLGVPGAWFVALLFALHPVYVESVAWVTERKNVLCAFFFLLSALSYLRFDATSRYRWFGLSLLCFLLAMFSKTVAASLPIGLALALWWRRRPFRRSHIATLLLMIGLGFVMGMLTRQHEYRHMLAEGSGSIFAQLTFVDRILIAGRAFWFYPAKLLWPTDLAFIYTRWPADAGNWMQWLYPLSAVLAGLLLLLLLYLGRIGRGPIAAALFYAVAIFPALGFVNIAFTRYSYVADHFQYIASIGVLLLVAGIGCALAGEARAGWYRSRRRLAILVLAVALLGTLGCLSHRQVGVFRDLGTLWEDTARKTPDNWIVQVNYGAYLGQHGRPAEAAACYERAIELSPPPSEAAILSYNNLASIRYREGRYEESRQMALKCLEVKPDHAPGLFNLGRALWRLGRLEEAEAILNSLLSAEYDPEKGRAAWDIRRRLDDAVVWFILAETQAGQDKADEALESYRRACELRPGESRFHSARLTAIYRWNRTSEAIAAARFASEHVEDAIPFLMQLSLLLAVAPDPADRDGHEALRIAEDLLARTDDQNPHILSLVAAAQAEVGRFAEAVATARRALSIAERTNDRGIQVRLKAQIDSFSKGQPLYHH
jgi:tetratricopeptide (TPR) repeat protein